ncbi:unnamed protein product [Lactuca saligna]|uniref:FCP1 homology domain-containing protein n=1 Tax=Lactuca saligna TaxID=75948 RepID=A0AA35Z6G7_LACSI|nr:unnamed protein product [Lactuca saligna]
MKIKISNTPEFVTYCCYICGQRCGQIKDVMEGFTYPVRAHFLEDYGQEKLWKTPHFVQEVFHEEEEPEIDDTNTPTVTGVKVEIPASSVVPINIKEEVVKTEKKVEVVQESTSLLAEPFTGTKSGKQKIKGVYTRAGSLAYNRSQALGWPEQSQSRKESSSGTLDDFAIIDNCPQVFQMQVNNEILIKSWFNNPSHCALITLLPFLVTLVDAIPIGIFHH